jgi:hypothetical protein
MMQPAPDRNGRTDRPRFRQDLVAESIEDQGARFIDVMDPDSGNLFRFYEVEYSLACGMDGERDVAGIVKWAQEELGMTPSAQEVRSVITTLGELGFIAAADAEVQPELASGVVAQAAPPAAYGSNDVELGLAGPSERREPSSPARREPATPAVTLGASGAAPARRAAETVEDVPLGNPGRGPARATPAPPIEDVSLDLADHIAVRRADVKEAVRASKVMSAVEVPQDLLDALEDKPVKPSRPAAALPRPVPAEAKKLPEPRVEARPAPAAPVAPVEPKPAPRNEARPEARPEVRNEARPEVRNEARPEIRNEARPEVRNEARPAPVLEPAPVAPAARPVAAKPAVELPKPPVVVEKPTQPTAPRRGVSPALIIVLILAVLGAAAFFVWKYVLQKPTADVDSSTQPAPPPVQPAVPAPPPPPPPAPTAKIAMELPAPDEITLAAPGVVETILADKSVVKADDVMVKLVGDKAVEAEITAATRELKVLQDKLDATTKKRDTAKAAGNKASETQAETELADRQKALGPKKDLLAAKTAELEKFLIHAKGNGTFTPSAKQGQKLTAHAVVATLQRDATPVATFKVTDPKPFAANASVELAIGKGEQHVACTVAEVQGDSVKVGCPADPALTDGADVTLKLPGAEAPAVPIVSPPGTEPPPAVPAGGSAAAPEAPGSAAPADPAPTAPTPSK